MIAIEGVHPVIMWMGFIGMVLIFLSLDLGLFNKKKHALSIKEAIIWSLVWFSLAMAFNALIWFKFGGTNALQFLTGYLIEESLSIDNLFVILLIFASFRINPDYQHRVLFWGIIGALVMRGIMILVGSALVSRFHWILYIFGIFLVYSGFRIFLQKEEKYDPHDSHIVKFIKRFIPVSRNPSDGKFFTKEKTKNVATMLFVALLVIEVSDVVFAFDSIPAIFGITTDPFIMFTSNIFAILGLRSLYFVILKAHKYFAYLPIGLAVILIFIGLKILLERIIDISIFTSLGVVGGIIAVYVIASLLFPPKNNKKSKYTLEVYR